MSAKKETVLEAMAAAREAGTTDATIQHGELRKVGAKPSYAELYPEWRAAHPQKVNWWERKPKPKASPAKVARMSYDEYRTYMYGRWGLEAPPLKKKRGPSKTLASLQQRVREMEGVIETLRETNAGLRALRAAKL